MIQRGPDTMEPLSPMQVLAQSLRDELIATRMRAHIDSARALARELGLDANKGHVQFWRFERGHSDWPRDPDAFVRSYADAAGVDPAGVWLSVARRWAEALASGEGPDVADLIASGE